MPNSSSAPSRRKFLASTAVAAAATVGGVPLLAACGSDGGSGGGEGRASQEDLKSILPTYRQSDTAIEPDIASENGSSPGYTTFIPTAELGVSVPTPKGNGGTFTA